MDIDLNLQEINAKELWSKLYGKELNTKNNILEYISLTKVLKEENVPSQLIQDTYTLIYNSIEQMSDVIKVNTKMHLRNQLKAQLGKYVAEKDPRPVNHFIEFFKEAYPENNRRKDFTWVLMDANKISEEQIWTTLTYINAWCLKEDNRLSEEQKKDTVKMIEKLVSKNNIRYINNVRSLEKLLVNLNIKIVNVNNKFRVKNR
jgi:hypothetical protein